MLWVLNNWKWLASGLGGIIATAALAWMLHSIDVTRLEAQHLKALDNLTVKLQTECQKDKDLTTEVSNDYQTKIAALNNQLATLKRLRERPQCVPVASASSGHDATPGSGEHVEPHGIMDTALLDFAAEGEQYRLQLISCQAFITKTWAAKTQSAR